VISYSQLLANRYEGQLDAEADEYIEFAVDGAKRMHSLLNDLTTYLRVSTDGSPFEPADCSEALNRALQELTLAIEENQARITHKNLPTVMADARQPVQLFQNLIGNSIKFRKEGTRPEIDVRAARSNDMWQFSVQDNGIGIEPQYFERIFGIFQRLHLREAYQGTGIGLAVCKRIVERHGGRIWAESERGQGSTFHFTIPIQRELEETDL